MSATIKANSNREAEEALDVIGGVAFLGFAIWAISKCLEGIGKRARAQQTGEKTEQKESVYDNGSVIDAAPITAASNAIPNPSAPSVSIPGAALAVVELPKQEVEPFLHSEGFRMVVYGGITYRLTTNQSVVVEKLWNAFQSHLPEVHQTNLYEGTSSCNYKKRLRDIFKGNMTAFRALIAKGERKGFFKLRFN